ncbi:MAG: hypothetical protein JSS81_07140 [Acidobacteria bacterium]|nr:hypothetical protein [Acidobacteriota bacterium]
MAMVMTDKTQTLLDLTEILSVLGVYVQEAHFNDYDSGAFTYQLTVNVEALNVEALLADEVKRKAAQAPEHPTGG